MPHSGAGGSHTPISGVERARLGVVPHPHVSHMLTAGLWPASVRACEPDDFERTSVQALTGGMPVAGALIYR